jgi:hypothetical protein
VNTGIRIAAACALLVLAACGTASAGPRMELGLMDEGVFLDERYYGADRGLEAARSLHVRRLRMNVLWANALTEGQAVARKAPAHPTYEWGRWDRAIARARRHGIKVQLSLTGPAPAWAAGNRRRGPFKPSAKQYGRFVSAAVKHFRGEVSRYSIWNEPNHVGWLRPLASGPALYRALYVAGYRAAVKADPRAQILMGETSPYALKGRSSSPLGFLRGVLCVDRRYRHRARSCPRLRADGYALHPYDARHSPTYRFPGADNVTIGTLGRLPAALDKLARLGALRTRRGGPMPVYLTEFGYLAYGKKKIPEARRARYLPQAFEIARRNPRVRELIQYELVQPPKGSPWFFWQSHLIDNTGAKTKTYHALRAWARRAAAKGTILR